MPLSTKGRPTDGRVATEIIQAVIDDGANLIDTANVYCLDDSDIGHNERLIAEALRKWPGPRERVLVATKGGLTRPRGAWVPNGKPADLKQACDRSLRALGAERIDLYQLHMPDPDVPFAESVGALSELQREGKIRWVGLSNVSVAQIKQASAQVTVVTVQNRLNPFFREALDTGVVEYCAQMGIGFLAYSPVGGGRLNRKLPDHPALQRLSERYGLSAHAVVLAWVLAQGSTVIPIPGARSVEHALDGRKALGVELTPDELAAIDDAEFSRA